MLELIYRDAWLVAINKPAGLLVHRSVLDRHETRFAVQLLRDQIGQPVYPVHRLDRGTSGLLLFALDKAVLTDAARAFETQAVAKRYLAVVRGWPDETGVITHPLKRIVDDYEFRHEQAGELPQEACTRYQRLATAEVPVAVERYPNTRYALLELRPETGRRHQIRRHLKHLAHPIIGDATYGKGVHNRAFQSLFGCHRLLLACCALSLQHPVSGERLDLVCPPGEDFQAACRTLGWQSALDDAFRA